MRTRNPVTVERCLDFVSAAAFLTNMSGRVCIDKLKAVGLTNVPKMYTYSIELGFLTQIDPDNRLSGTKWEVGLPLNEAAKLLFDRYQLRAEEYAQKVAKERQSKVTHNPVPELTDRQLIEKINTKLDILMNELEIDINEVH